MIFIETIRIINYKIPLIDFHVKRLLQSLHAIGFDINFQELKSKLAEQIKQTFDTFNTPHLRVKVETELMNNNLHFFISAQPLQNDTFTLNKTGLQLTIFKEQSKSINKFANFKTTNRAIYAAAVKYASLHKFDDALVLNENGNICDAGIYNIFMIKDNVIYTPPLSDAPVAGVLRSFLLEKVTSFPIFEKSITEQELYTADELFLTNAVRGIQWVKLLNNHQYTNTITSLVFDALKLKVNGEMY